MQLQLVELIQSKLPDVRAALPPRTIDAERLNVAFRGAFNRKPKLAKCSQMSICAALVNCATLGIVPETPEQHAYLIPRNVKHGNDWVLECNLDISYRGFTHLILRGGKVSHVDSGVIKKGDDYEFQKGEPVICKVRPNLETANRGAQPTIAAYCLIVFHGGGMKLEVMDGDDLAKLERAMMRQNDGKASPSWKEWPDEMKRKGPIKRIAKTCDLGPLVARAAEIDNEAFRRLPSAEPKTLILPGGEAVMALPRHPTAPEAETPAGVDPVATDDPNRDLSEEEAWGK